METNRVCFGRNEDSMTHTPLIQLQLKARHEARYKKGEPLLVKEAVQNPERLSKEGQIVELLDSKNQYLATGYYGRQNKGLGWLLTHNRKEVIDQAFFTKKLAKALAIRAPFFQSSETTAFRVFNGEGDGIGGLTVDYFNGYYVINWYSEGIYAFRDLIVHALTTVGAISGIYEKKRFDSDGHYIDDDDFVWGERAEFPLIVKENGVQFAVYLNEGAMVGVFLDQRNVRERIRASYSAGRTVLNTFSYTGAFSVYAALGGATKTTSVDLANRSRRKTEEQFEINGIDPETQEILVMDVFDYFKYAVRNHLQFDTVVLDPPSFARSKKRMFRAEKDYTALLKEAITITSSGGTIVASTNASTFGMKKFKQFIQQAFQETGKTYRILETFSLPEDFKTDPAFPEGNYLKVVFVEKLG